MIRDGKDTIASLYEVTRKNPEKWGGKRDLTSCINRWITDVQISLQLRDRPNHVFVIYEALVEDPEEVLKNLCPKLDLDFRNTMVQRFQEAYKKIRVKDATWTNGAAQPVYKNPQSKFCSVLSGEQRAYVLRFLGEKNLLNVATLFYL